jgi:hypothetical protein
MVNHNSQNGNFSLQLPTFIPLTEALRKYNLTEEVLTRLIQDGRIEAAQLPSGELLVSDESLNGKTKEQIIEEQFGHLRGKLITISEAAEKYDVSRKTVEAWIYRNQYLSIIDDTSYPKRIDEAEVAYCANIYHERQKMGLRHGIPLLDEDGLPVLELKHPELAKYRRKKKQIN